MVIVCFRTMSDDGILLFSDLANERMSDEEKLFKALFKGYNPSSRPVMNSSKSVNVNVQFSLMHIKELVSILISLSPVKRSSPILQIFA